MRTSIHAHKAVANGAHMQGSCAHRPSGGSGPCLGGRRPFCVRGKPGALMASGLEGSKRGQGEARAGKLTDRMLHLQRGAGSSLRSRRPREIEGGGGAPLCLALPMLPRPWAAPQTKARELEDTRGVEGGSNG